MTLPSFTDLIGDWLTEKFPDMHLSRMPERDDAITVFGLYGSIYCPKQHLLVNIGSTSVVMRNADTINAADPEFFNKLVEYFSGHDCD